MQATADMNLLTIYKTQWVGPHAREADHHRHQRGFYLGATRILQCCVRSLDSRRTQPVDPILKCFKDPILVQIPNFFFKMGI
jgi:hypothetical protein